jgi:hypothetical protein
MRQPNSTRKSLVVCAAALLFCASASVSATVFTVTSTDDSGPNTLRAVITTLNGSAGPHVVNFNLSGANCDGSGVCTINLMTDLPCVTQVVNINGYSQPGASPNNLAVGSDAALKVRLHSVGASQGICLNFGSEGSSVRGLVIGGFVGFNALGSGIVLSSGTNTVAGNFIGTNADGSAADANGTGVSVFNTACVIGGTAPADRNLLSGNIRSGIGISGGLSTSTLIQGNYIGTNAAGTAKIPNLTHGILSQGAGTVIGGNPPGIIVDSPDGNGSSSGNLISGNVYGGVHITHPNVVVQRNLIGTDATGSLPLGNGYGVGFERENNLVGGLGAGEGNHIAYNNIGVAVAGSTGGISNRIVGNSIHSNSGAPPGLGLNMAGLGIDLIPGATDGVTPNDAGDPDDGPNHYQNFPFIYEVTYGPTNTTVKGKLDSLASTQFTIDFYRDEICLSRPQEFPEGKVYLGNAQVTTNASGISFFTTVLPIALPVDTRITATATSPDNSTSEFSQRMVLSIDPVSGPSTGGTPVTISGFNFLPGAAVDFSGSGATDEVVTNYNQMTATSPARPPGTVSSVQVVNTSDGTYGSLPSGWVSDFLDVTPVSSFAYGFVTKLVANLITAGCSGGNYCPNDPVTRAQMAVFLLRSKNGVCYTPPPPTGTLFGDVSTGTFAAAWIEALAAAQVTSGCGGGNYCPDSAVTRDQMAVFLLRMLEGPTYVAPNCTMSSFGDVPCDNTGGFSRWIYELVARGITAGCGGNNYCPTLVVTRGQMAVFLVVTFQL